MCNYWYDLRYVFTLDRNTRAHQMLGGLGDLIVHLLTKTVGILAHAVKKRNAHGYGANIEVLLAYHTNGFQNISHV